MSGRYFQFNFYMEQMVRNVFSLTPNFLLYVTNTWIVVVVYVTRYFLVIVNRDTKCRCFYSVFAIELTDVINVNGCKSNGRERRGELSVKIHDTCHVLIEFVDCSCICLLYTSPSPRDGLLSRMPSSA